MDVKDDPDPEIGDEENADASKVIVLTSSAGGTSLRLRYGPSDDGVLLYGGGRSGIGRKGIEVGDEEEECVGGSGCNGRAEGWTCFC